MKFKNCVSNISVPTLHVFINSLPYLTCISYHFRSGNLELLQEHPQTDILLTSYNLSACKCIKVVRRNTLFVTPGSGIVKTTLLIAFTAHNTQKNLRKYYMKYRCLMSYTQNSQASYDSKLSNTDLNSFPRSFTWFDYK